MIQRSLACNRRRYFIVAIAMLISAAVLSSLTPVQQFLARIGLRIRGVYSVAERVGQYETVVGERLQPAFSKANVTYPPAELTFLVFKDRRRLEVYARDRSTEPWCFIVEYPVLAASGELGPKLKRGDNQVPEGIYRPEFLNANSRFHLSIRLNYPNQFDTQMAIADARSDLGGDIMIHGGSSSVGCVAVGDEAAEDLFVLAALAGVENLKIVICPTDFRVSQNVPTGSGPVWLSDLYAQLRQEILAFHR